MKALAMAALALAIGFRAAEPQLSPGYKAYEKANQFFVAQKFPECAEAIEEALRLDPKLTPALTLKAKLAMAQNRFDVARESLERAIAADPSGWYAHFLYGFQFYLKNELQLALPALEKARKLNARDPRPLVYLGLTEESLGETAKALALYEEALRLEEAAGAPQADTMLVCAKLLMALDRMEDAGRLLEKAVKSAPGSRDVRFERARYLLKKGAAAEAAREAEAALRLPGPGLPDRQIHYLLIRAYKAVGNEAEAARHAAAMRALER